MPEMAGGGLRGLVGPISSSAFGRVEFERGEGVESRGDLPGSVPSSWLGQALPNARQCGACFYGEVPGSAIAFGFGPELRPTSGRGLERLLDQEWLRLPTACLLRSAGFPDEQLRPPLQLQALRRYSARSVPERRRGRVGKRLLVSGDRGLEHRVRRADASGPFSPGGRRFEPAPYPIRG